MAQNMSFGGHQKKKSEYRPNTYCQRQKCRTQMLLHNLKLSHQNDCSIAVVFLLFIRPPKMAVFHNWKCVHLYNVDPKIGRHPRNNFGGNCYFYI